MKIDKKWIWTGSALAAALAAGAVFSFVLKHKDRADEDSMIKKDVDIIEKRDAEPLRAEISIGYTVDRADEFFNKFSIKISGSSALVEDKRIQQCFEKIISITSLEKCGNEVDALKALALDGYKLEHSSGILIFLASFYVNIGQYEEAVAVLESVVASKDPVWASMSQCVIGRLYEKFIKDKIKAGEAYSKILLDHPNSPEVSYASWAMREL